MFLRAGRFFGAGLTLSLVFWGTVFTCGPEFEKHEKALHIQLTKNLDPKRKPDNSQQETYAPAGCHAHSRYSANEHAWTNPP